MADGIESDAELMLRVKNGDLDAFECLVEKYKQPVINLIFRTVRDLDEAEDLAQNVFIQVFKAAGRYEASAKFTTWLFTIARNMSLNEIRRRSRHPAESLDHSDLETEDQPVRQHPDKTALAAPDRMLRSELEQKVEEAIMELPETQRTALLLCREEELSYEEIAKVLDCSLSATKSIIHRGREVLKQKLKPYLQSGSWKSSTESQTH